MKRRRVASWLILWLLIFTVSACGGLAGSGDVRPGIPLEQGRQNNPRVIPAGPSPGAQPEAIVRGFIRALAASDGDYTVARAFLDDALARRWEPDAGSVVLAASPTYSAIGEDTIVATASSWASVDDQGHFELAAPKATVRLQATLDRVDGQWRITQLPEGFGRWIARSDFPRLYTPVLLHYVTTGEQNLLVDRRYLPDDHLPTRLAAAQIAPLPDYLAGGAINPIPSSTTLAVAAVPVASSVASVDLHGPNIGTDATTRVNIWAVLVATLRQAPGVSAVSVLVDGETLELRGGIQAAWSLTDLDFPEPANLPLATPLVRRGEQIQQVDPRPEWDTAGKGTAPAPGVSANFAPIPSDWTRLALSVAGTEIAGVNADQLARWRGTLEIDTAPFATALGRPSYDRHDVLWVGGIGLSGGQLFAVNTAADPADVELSAPRPVVAPWLGGQLISVSQVSPDGNRIAIVHRPRGGGDSVLDVAVVIRQPNGLPTALSPPQPVARHVGSVVDAMWLSPSELAVLAAPGEGDGTIPYLVDLGGQLTPLPAVPDAVAITSYGQERSLVVTTAQRGIFLRAGLQWLPLASGGSDFLVGGR